MNKLYEPDLINVGCGISNKAFFTLDIYRIFPGEYGGGMKTLAGSPGATELAKRQPAGRL